MSRRDSSFKKPRAGIGALEWALGNGHIWDFEMAIDGGACVGEWTIAMAPHFERVVGFEPCEESAILWHKNCDGLDNAMLYPWALMDKPCNVESFTPPKRKALEGRQVRESAGGTIKGFAIDDARFDSCGLIKLDLEGCEPLALEGARDTIVRCRPVLIIEVGKHLNRFSSIEATRSHIYSLGYIRAHTHVIDEVFLPAERGE